MSTEPLHIADSKSNVDVVDRALKTTLGSEEVTVKGDEVRDINYLLERILETNKKIVQHLELITDTENIK